MSLFIQHHINIRGYTINEFGNHWFYVYVVPQVSFWELASFYRKVIKTSSFKNKPKWHFHINIFDQNRSILDSILHDVDPGGNSTVLSGDECWSEVSIGSSTSMAKDVALGRWHRVVYALCFFFVWRTVSSTVRLDHILFLQLISISFAVVKLPTVSSSLYFLSGWRVLSKKSNLLFLINGSQISRK